MWLSRQRWRRREPTVCFVGRFRCADSVRGQSSRRALERAPLPLLQMRHTFSSVQFSSVQFLNADRLTFRLLREKCKRKVQTKSANEKCAGRFARLNPSTTQESGFLCCTSGAHATAVSSGMADQSGQQRRPKRARPSLQPPAVATGATKFSRSSSCGAAAPSNKSRPSVLI